MPDFDDRPMGPPPGGPGGPPPDGFIDNRYADNYFTPYDARRGDDSVRMMGKVNRNNDKRNVDNTDPNEIRYISPTTHANRKARRKVAREFREYVKGYNVFRKSIIKNLRKIQSIEAKLEKHKHEPDSAFGRDKLNDKLEALKLQVTKDKNELNTGGKSFLVHDSIALYGQNLYPDSAFVFSASSPIKYNPILQTINNKGFVQNPYLNTNNNPKKNNSKSNNNNKTNQTVNNKINNAVDDAKDAQKDPEKIVKQAYDDLVNKYGKDFVERHMGKGSNTNNASINKHDDKNDSFIDTADDNNFKKNINDTYNYLVSKYGKDYVERNYDKKAFDNAYIRKYPNLDLGLIAEELYLKDNDSKSAKDRFERAYKEVVSESIKNNNSFALEDKNKNRIENKKLDSWINKQKDANKNNNLTDAQVEKLKNINMNIKKEEISQSVYDSLLPSDYGLSKDAFDEIKSEGYSVGSSEFENAAKEFGGHGLTSDTIETLNDLQNDIEVDKNKKSIKEKGVSDEVASLLAKSDLDINDNVINTVKKLETNNSKKRENGNFEDAINDSIEKLEDEDEINNSSFKADDYGLSKDDYKEIASSGIKPGTEEFNTASKIYGGHSYSKSEDNPKEKVFDFSKEEELDKYKNLKKELTEALRKAKHDNALNSMLDNDSEVKSNSRSK